MRVGPFVVIDQLSMGGVAKVFRARFHPEDDQHAHLPLDRGEVVTLKVMRRQLDLAPEDAEGFNKEADLLVTIDHPGVVQAFTRGVHAGRVWIALEYVEGESVENVLYALKPKDLRLKPEVAVTFALDLSAALAACHALTDPRGRPLGLVHRDVAPRNVLIDVAGNVRLLDFGTAVLTAQDEVDPSSVVGSPGYLSPEQARAEPLHAASDIYGVGIMLFELLTGRRAFPVEDSPDETVLQVHAAGVRPAWPAHTPIPDPIKKIVDRMTDPDQYQRPADGAELFHLLSPLAGDLDASRAALAAIARDLVLSNADRPPPIFLAN